ncbi:MAG: EF-hand domain-containing protein [Burkholderiaceae bacterium]|nr:EF-hand domain-containing protein [Burkholderiaceae bacterium]
MKQLSRLLVAAAGLLIGSAALADHHGGGMHEHQGKDARMPMFGLFDENKDGKLSRDEVQKGVDKMFADIDANKDGTISQDEMRAHHKTMHDKMQSQMQERWKAADKDGDGALSRAEVDAAKMPMLSRDFDKFDADKDGKLTADEMRNAMMQRRQGGAAPKAQ